MKNIKISLLVFSSLCFSVISFSQEKKWPLEECVIYALQHNVAIKQSLLEVQLANVSRNMALGNFLPSVNMQGSHSWNIGLNQNITTGLLENQTSQFTSAGLNVGIDVYKGLQNQNQLRKSVLSKLAATYQVTKMQEDVSLNVVNGYLQILFNKENLKIQQQQLLFDTKRLIRTNELVSAGVIARGDLLDVNATIATDNQRLVAAENALFLSKLSLAQLLQLSDYDVFDIADLQTEIQENAILLEDSKVILAKAKENRTDLKIAQTNVLIAQKEVAISRGAYQPTLRAFYSFSTRAGYASRVVGFEPDPVNPFSQIGFVAGSNELVFRPNYSPVLGGALPIFEQFSKNKGQNFGLNLSIPILNGFAVKNRVSQSKIALERSRNALSQQETDLERTVFTAISDTKGAKKFHEAALATLLARTQAFNFAKERYEVGLMNVFDLNQSQTLLVNAQSEVLRTKYDYIFRSKILEFYFGIPIIKINN